MSHTTLAHLPRKLSQTAQHAGKPTPSYKQCYRAVLDGAIPAEKVGREWHVADTDLPTIAATLGLTASAQPVPAQAA